MCSRFYEFSWLPPEGFSILNCKVPLVFQKTKHSDSSAKILYQFVGTILFLSLVGTVILENINKISSWGQTNL